MVNKKNKHYPLYCLKGSCFILKQTLIGLAIIIICGVILKPAEEIKVIIPPNSLRVRVVANSNNIKDYEVKMQVKAIVERELTELLAGAQTIGAAEDLVKANLAPIEKAITEVLSPLNIPYKISFGSNYFPSKIFKGVVYQAGEYESLVVTIGQGAGDNWWCVLFPPLCLLEDNENTSDVEYQFYISRIINQFK